MSTSARALTFLLTLMISWTITMFHTPTLVGYVTSNYPLGFLQLLPLVFWITSVSYSILCALAKKRNS